MATIPPYTHLDYGARLAALRDVGFALGAGNANVPDNKATLGHNAVYWINKLRVQQALPPLPSLDFGGFQAALNVLAART